MTDREETAEEFERRMSFREEYERLLGEAAYDWGMAQQDLETLDD